MATPSPLRRRASPPSRRVDSTPMLMSRRSELDTTDLVDGRIVLTPKRDMSQQFGDVYEQVGTPLHDPTRTEPLRTSSKPRILSGSASMRKLRATQSYHSGVATSAAGRPTLSRGVVKLWHFIANAVMVLALVTSVVTRVTAISAVYLLVLCFGLARTFASTPLVLFTIALSALACVGHIVCGILLRNVRDGYEGQNILAIIGFARLSDSTTVLRYAGVDALVLVCSVFHFFVVLRRLRLPMEAEGFDYFDAAAAFLGQDGDATRRKSRKKSSMIHKVELLSAVLLFLTAFSVPAAVSAVFFLLLVWLLVMWTVAAKRIAVDEFVHHRVRTDFFLGETIAKLLLGLSFVTVVAWYILLFPDISSSTIGRDIIKYAGFADFSRGSIKWQYYVFIAVVSLLFVCTAKLVKLHHALEQLDATTTDPRVSLVDIEGSTARPSPAMPPRGAVAIQGLLRQLPFHSRMFLQDGGSLLASGAAIFWCVSYPSYGSAPMMGWALATLAVYGLVPSAPLVVVLICYATALSMTEYAVNLTWDFVSADYTKYGLKQFDYPFLDLGAHNLCLVVIYASMRTRWRYEDVIKAAKQEEARAATTLADEPERNSMDAFRAMMGARRTPATWKELLPLWFQDAKQVVVTHLGALVLLTIVAVALSTRESLFQAGFLIMAMLCIIFFRRRQQLWRALLVYALAVCLAIFIRNVDCKQSDRLDLIGLECYSETAVTWRSLWPTLFSAQLVIIFQLVFQLVIYVANAKTIDQRIKTIDTSHQNPLFFVSRIAVEVDNCFRVIGGAVCYVVMLVVLFQFEILDAGAHTTVLGAVQLVVLLVVVGGHLGKFKRTPRTSLRLKLLWSLVLVLEVVILVARYIFHFQDVSTYFEQHLFTSSFMSARAFGLEKRSSKASLSGVFLYLAPTATIIGVTFWQLTSMMKPVRSYELLVAGRSQLIDRVLFWMDTIRRVLIAFSTTALVLVTMCVALWSINAIGAAYVVVLVVGRPLSSWQKLWFPLFWVSAIAIGATYAYQLRLFGGADTSTTDGYVRVDIDKDAHWFGLDRLVVVSTSDGVRTASTSMWKLTGGPFLVILMCFMQRMAQYLEGAFKKSATEFMPMQPTQNENLSPDAVGSFAGLSPDTANDSEVTPAQSRSKLQSFLSPTAPHATADDDATSEQEDADFFSHLRDFCIEYASSASMNVVMLLLTASAFLHRDVISIAYLLIVYGMMYASPVKVCRLWFLLAFGLSLVILLEYTLIVWLPPLVGVAQQDYQPWKSLTPAQQQWFALSHQHKWALLADFVALLAAYMLPNSNRLRPVESSVVDIRIQRASTRHGSVSFATVLQRRGSMGDATAVAKAEAHESEFIRQTRTSAWHAVVYFVLLAWLPVTLVVTFVCGAKHGGIASFVYIGGAVFMLYRLDDARLRSSKWIHQLRRFNWIHLFVMVVISAPYIKDTLSKCLVGANDGSGDVCLSVEELLGVQTDSVPAGIIAIFVLISIQCEMLATDTYDAVCQHIQLEKLQAPARQEAIVKHFYRERTAQWFALKKDKSAALQRLKMIVSKLVHKVEELMDIAMGLHYNLPPMAPPKPHLVERFQNAVTIEWAPPQESLHKIRFYRITRQQFPSQTLLGDFSDVVEVKGDTLSAKIEGLRPGTSYQFKVAAVSRMGEGPFSVASDPIATYPLNLDGSCTAGWMKYRRENVAQSWYSAWLAKLQPKYLHRYVVLDHKHLVFYKDEELALRHRSKRRRKRIKTSFAWKDVLTLRLSDDKIQFDDVSPKLFCFELIVRQDGNHADLKYTFQVDVTQEFDRFLSALAFAVPRYTVEDSILQCLREKKLPVPDEVPAGDDHDAADDTGSEMSSVTGGEESSFGDAEDAEFDEQPQRSWKLPVYRWLYALQDAAMQAETTEYDAEDQVEPSAGEIVSVLINAIRSRTVGWCYVAMVLAFARQADLLNFVYIVCTFGYLAIESPRPSSRSWVLLLKYTCCIILVRYVFQLPVFCQGLSGGGYFYPSIQPLCGAPSNSVVLQEQTIQPVVLLGVYKFDGTTVAGQDDIYGGLQWDFFIALAILWHRRELIIRGLWVDAAPRDENGEDMQLTASRRLLNGSDVSSRDSIDESFNFGGLGGRSLARAVAHSEPVELPSIPHDEAELEQELQQPVQEADLTEQILQELEAEEQEEQRKAREVEEMALESNPAPGSTALQDDTVNTVTEQIDMEDAGDSVVMETMNKDKKKSWLERTYPQVYVFFQGVICDPPPHWDKDIHAAIAGSKPGRDYYAASLSVMLFACVFAIIFFQAIGGPDANASNTNGQVQSSSMVSGYLVLIVFIQLCFIIWDRAAYICGSLTTKIVLQYSYIFLLHLCLWVLMPSHVGEYFQHRAMLVIFYLLHCLYLWLGALQIRYGYPVFRGSKYNTTDDSGYHRIRESVFPLVMLAPFLFEMRALLDYVCTKTSLSWQHWVLLEDTAAHLYQVKLEMRGRVEAADVLQGKQRQPVHKKLLSAGVMLLFLLLCLIGPLLLFSSANPSTTPNRVTTTEVVFGIEDARGTVNKLYTGVDINSPDYEGEQIADGAAVQRVTYDTFSRDVWASSPPNIERLVTQLNSTESLSWILTISFTRPGPTDHQTIETTQRVPLTTADRQALAPLIQANSSTTSATAKAIEVVGILPPIVELTATSGVFRLSSQLRNVTVRKQVDGSSSWWSVTPILRSNEAVLSANDREMCDETAPFCLIAVSDNIVEGLTSLGIGSYGITAVYIFVLVTVGSAVKGFFRGALFQIQYTELPDPEDVLELVEGIYIARSERYVGHLKDEVRIFETLVRVLRSPETLTKVTGTNVIHIPTAKEKLD